MIQGISKLAIEKFRWNDVVIRVIGDDGKEVKYQYDSPTWMRKRIEKMFDQGYSIYKLMVRNEYYDLNIYMKKLSQPANVTFGQETEYFSDGSVATIFNHGTWREYGVRRAGVYDNP